MTIPRFGQLALVVLMVGATLSVSGGTARACSCAPATPQQFFVDSEAGFVGTLSDVDRRDNDAVYTFDVEVWLNGDLDASTVDVVSAGDGAACGFEIPDGGRAAVFLYRDGDDLTGGLCSTLDADVVLAATDPEPLPGGEALLAVAGTFEQGSLALLDAQGRLLGYGGGPPGFGPPLIVPCADGRHVVAVGFPSVDVIDLRTLDVVAQVDTGTLQQSAVIEDVDCGEGSPESVRLLVQSAAGLERERDVRTLAAPTVPGTPIEALPGARVVLVADGLFGAEPLDPGDQLVMFTADGERQILATLDRPAGSNLATYQSLEPSPSGTRIAVSAVTYLQSGVEARLALRDAGTGDELVVVDVGQDVYVNGWLDENTLITTEGSSTLTLRDASTLEIRAQIADWPGFGATIVGDTAWATNAGTVLRGSFESGTVDEVATLPSQSTGQVLAMLEPVEVAPAEVQSLVTPRAPGVPPPTDSVDDSTVEPVGVTAAPVGPTTAPGAGDVAPSPSSVGGGSVPLAVIVVTLIVISAGVAVVWRRSRRATLPA
jgi:hypothetical protein